MPRWTGDTPYLNLVLSGYSSTGKPFYGVKPLEKAVNPVSQISTGKPFSVVKVMQKPAKPVSLIFTGKPFCVVKLLENPVNQDFYYKKEMYTFLL